MFIMCGYNFCRDKNALTPAPITINNFTDTKLTNGIFNHWNVTRDVTSPQSTTIPTTWEFLTIMNANFNGNIEAGNFDAVLESIEGFKIKRRKIDEFNWVTLKYLPMSEIEGLSFVFEDNLAQSGIEYEYAFVPIVGGIEGNYISNTIKTRFNGVFICDLDTIYKFYIGVEYGSQEQVHKVGVFEPYGKKYPVIVSNALTNYATGSVKGTVIQNDYATNKNLNALAMAKERKDLLDFLTNKKAKILKDWNGNIWLMIITGNPTTNFMANSSMALAEVNASWTEIGEANTQADLYNVGMIEEVE